MFFRVWNKNYSPVRAFGGVFSPRSKTLIWRLRHSRVCDVTSPLGLFGAVPGQP